MDLQRKWEGVEDLHPMAWAHLTLVRMVVVVLYIPGEVVGLTGRPVVAGLEAVNVVVFARLFVLEEVNDVVGDRSLGLEEVNVLGLARLLA